MIKVNKMFLLAAMLINVVGCANSQNTQSETKNIFGTDDRKSFADPAVAGQMTRLRSVGMLYNPDPSKGGQVCTGTLVAPTLGITADIAKT